MNECVYVPFTQLKIGQKILGYRLGKLDSSFVGYIRRFFPDFVEVDIYGKTKKISTTAMFAREMLPEEFRKKYHSAALSAITNIQNKLYYDEIGYHEMWNAWLRLDPFELAQQCLKNGITIVGHCTDITPKRSWLGEMLDVGVCAEYKDGERFWCHWKKTDIDELKTWFDLAMAGELD